jgi:hypothetical protein
MKCTLSIPSNRMLQSSENKRNMDTGFHKLITNKQVFLYRNMFHRKTCRWSWALTIFHYKWFTAEIWNTFMQYTHKIIQLLPHREHCIFTTKSKWLVTFRKKSIIYWKHHTKLTNSCCGLNADHLLSEQEAYIRYYCARKEFTKANET